MKSVLIITNKEDVTVDFVIKELQNRNILYYRLNTEDIPDKISIEFDLTSDSYILIDKIKEVNVNVLDFSSVYYRRPILNRFEYIQEVSPQEVYYLQNEISFLLEGIYKILRDKNWLNNVYDIREAENKIYQLQLAKELGFKIPYTIITNRISSVKKAYELCKEDCVIKPIKSGYLHDNINPRVIFTTRLSLDQIDRAERIESFPIYMQENIHKEFDLRITVVGKSVFPAKIDSQEQEESRIDWRKGQLNLRHAICDLPDEIKTKCIDLTHRLNLNYSAIDMIVDENGDYIFLEINPNGQWAWIEKRLDFHISAKIVDLLIGGES